ncbi:trefoil factor 1 isoform X1 [Pteropus vampyrus]|uniref:Trefoil factor 1 isoform X1 n=1 Tax=Pteropus vampyrus TaxID=132908 RepID=A0A6P6D383_PTEVA|nr:trefoil factor 1 isoform X1 [Pteropus vampyrus]
MSRRIRRNHFRGPFPGGEPSPTTWTAVEKSSCGHGLFKATSGVRSPKNCGSGSVLTGRMLFSTETCLEITAEPRAVLGRSAEASETCEVTPTERKNCGFPGITARACHEKGCCFNSATRGVPWCFYPSSRNAPEDVPDECEF